MRHSKLFISIFYIFFFAALAFGRGDYYKGAETPVVAGCVAQAKITFWWECENTTVDYSAGDNTVDQLGSTPASLTTDAKKSGTYGCDSPLADDYFQIDQTDTSIFGSEGRVGFWVYVNSGMGTNTPSLMKIELNTSVPNYSFKLTGSGPAYAKITWDNTTNSDINITSGSACISASTWYWVEFWYDDSDDTVGFQVYDTNLDPVSDCSGSGSGTFDTLGTPDDFNIGNNSVSGDYYIDHVIVVNDHEQSLLSCANESSYPY